MSEISEQSDEVMALQSIFERDTFDCDVSKRPYTGRVVARLQDDSGPYDVLCRGTVVSLKHLSPIVLRFSLPPGYPSSSPPDSELSCCWLMPDQLEILSNRLKDLWLEGCNGAVLFTWTTFLQVEALKFLDFKFPVQVSEEALADLTQYSLERMEDEFNKGHHECPVCFGERPGTECLRLEVCGHLVCRECLSRFLAVHIAEGNMRSLNCPAEGCSTQIHPSVIKQLASKEDFDRYERLLLEKTLDTMSDIQYCPRPACGKPVVVEEGENMGMCQACKLAFCVHCRLTYHGIQKCRIGELNDLRKMQEMRDAYLLGSKEERRHLERLHGKKKLQVILDECGSAEWLDSNSKRCPKCTAHIEKTSGCNRMVCGKCGVSFCWLCLEVLKSHDPYDHYSNMESPCFERCLDGVEEDG